MTPEAMGSTQSSHRAATKRFKRGLRPRSLLLHNQKVVVMERAEYVKEFYVWKKLRVFLNIWTKRFHLVWNDVLDYVDAILIDAVSRWST